MKINVDQDEIDKFDNLASRWWDPQGDFKPLHDINPLRLDYIDNIAHLSGKKVLDVGCGGGILSEGMAKRGAVVDGIDLAEAPLEVAKLHLLESGLSVNYQKIAVEQHVMEHAGVYDVISCMEMMEHVPDPASIIQACAQLLKPDGHLFLSTINRNPKAYLLAVVGAEYVLRMLPVGTHDYEKFIKPSELTSWCRQVDLTVDNIKGMSYNPFNRTYSLGDDVSVNYLIHSQK